MSAVAKEQRSGRVAPMAAMYDDDEITRRKRDVLSGAFLVGIGLFLLASLISYNADDPSFNRAADRPIENWGGYWGARLSDLFLQSFGMASALFVLVPVTWGAVLLLGRKIFRWRWKIAAFTLLLPIVASLFAYIEAPISWNVAHGLGGAIGAVVRDATRPLLLPGAYPLIAGTACFIGFLYVMGLRWADWKHIFLGIGKGTAFTVKALPAMRAERRLVQHSPYQEERWTTKLLRMLKLRRITSEDDEEYYDDEEDDEEIQEAQSRKAGASIEKPKSTAARSSQPTLGLSKPRRGKYEMPSVDMLASPPVKGKKQVLNESALAQNAKLLETVLKDYGVNGEIVKIRPGPVVTLYELEPSPGTKSSRVIGLSDDIARSMSAVSARIAVIPGRNAIGIELPNSNRETVYLRELLEDDTFGATDSKLPLALGKDIGGAPIVVDLAKMPHLLVAGTTGSGKSVAINTMITSLLYHLTPDECKFIMIDPKMLELSVYDDIPHLLTPVVTEPGKAVVALKWTVKEMDSRYRLMANLGVKNIESYNKRIREAKQSGEELFRNVQTGFDPETGKPIIEKVPLDMNPLPFIVVVVDEMADLMLVAGKDIESLIQRLAQMARAAGIHIIMATQRPSVDVITGVIKANFPSRISFQVTSKIDSRTILNEQGAEQLLGQGDMLYMAGGARITRVHSPFISSKETDEIVAHLRAQGSPTYIEEVTIDESENEGFDGGEHSEEDNALYEQAVGIVLRDRKASTSYVQRCLKIGYNRAAGIIDRMEREGVVSAANHVGKREVIG